MDLVLLLKLAHVVAALLWVGGVAILALLVVLTDRRGDDAATLGTLGLLGLAGRHVFARAMPATLLTGAVLAWLGGWGASPWVLLSAALAGANFAYLKLAMAPATGRILAARGAGDLAGAATLARAQLRRIGADLCLKTAIVVLMVLKPGWADPLLALPAAALLAGLALHLSATARAPAAQPA